MSIEEELEKLRLYRELFKKIISQEDKTLTYSTQELEYYYKEIENSND